MIKFRANFNIIGCGKRLHSALGTTFSQRFGHKMSVNRDQKC